MSVVFFPRGKNHSAAGPDLFIYSENAVSGPSRPTGLFPPGGGFFPRGKKPLGQEPDLFKYSEPSRLWGHEGRLGRPPRTPDFREIL